MEESFEQITAVTDNIDEQKTFGKFYEPVEFVLTVLLDNAQVQWRVIFLMIKLSANNLHSINLKLNKYPISIDIDQITMNSFDTYVNDYMHLSCYISLSNAHIVLL